jgi:cell division septation protein DedD
VNSRYLEDDDIDDIPRDREISLGAPTILGIFFLIALVCAVFFGFGYSFGRKSSSAAIATPSGNSVEASSIRTSGASKPSAAEAPSETAAPEPVDTASSSSPENIPTEQPAVVAQPPAKHVVALKPAPVKPVPVAVERPAAPAPASREAASGPAVLSLVQVAAVSHQEDADVLLNALKRRGYNVALRHEPQDKLLHIQIGPLASRKDADTMRQRLLADGYKAIIK